jgi:predicted amidohydrolase
MSSVSGDIKVAAVQMDPQLGLLEKNREKALGMIDTAIQNGARLIVLPECAITGYMFTSKEEAQPALETVPGPTTEQMTEKASRAGVYIVYGMLEKEDDKIFNTAVLIGPKGVVGKYQKIQPPHMGIDEYVQPGNVVPEVFETEVGTLGIMICMDTAFPEHARVLALKGAEILIVPTNTPAGTEAIARAAQSTRAMENHCFEIYSNRCGTELGDRGTFMGLSMIFGVWGELLAEASITTPEGDKIAREEIIYGVVDPAVTRDKCMQGPGWWCDLWLARRPELYTPIVEPK